MAPHPHDSPSLTVVLAGDYEETIRGRSSRHGPGAMLFCPANEPHAQTFGAAGALKLLLSPSVLALDLLAERLRLGDAPSTLSPEIARLGRRMAAELALDDPFSPAVLEGLSWELVGLFGRGAERVAAAPSAQVAAACEHMAADLARPMSVEALAALVGRHPAWLTRAFRRELGHTPGEHQRRLRMARAAELVGDARMPLSEVALVCGFCDQSHLTRTFKAAFGCTPSALRRRS
jgi:AraC family transcriptional regulator